MIVRFATISAISVCAIASGTKAVAQNYTASGDQLPTFKEGQLVTCGERGGKNIGPGDMIVFRHPVSNSVWMKTVVGVGGDEVKLNRAIVSINGHAIPRQRLPDYQLATGKRVAQFEETYKNGAKVRILQESDTSDIDFFSGKVPADHVFVLGNHRSNSTDSRSPRGAGGGPGAIPINNIICKVKLPHA